MRVRSLAAVVVPVAAVLAFAPVAASAEEDGKAIFLQRCAGCHGKDGKGNEKMAKTLKATIPDLTVASKASEAEILKLVSEGKKPMPGFQKTLKQEQIDAVLAYVKDLAKGQ